MKRLLAALICFAALNLHAQAIDRTGNVIDDDGVGGGAGFEVVMMGIFVGAVLGAIYAKYQQSQGKPFATDGGVVIGGLIGMFAWPVLMILTK